MFKYILILTLLPNIGFSESSVWQISNANHILYLGGTIHALKKDDYPLPAEFSAAFSKANKLIVETDIDASQSEQFRNKMMKSLTYSAGESLKDSLDGETFELLSRYFSKRGLSINAFLAFKPVLVVLTMSMMEFSRIGMTGKGVDEFFYRKAQESGKSIGYFESVDQQLSFIVNMGAGRENELVRKTLDDVASMEESINAMKSAWRSGNALKLAEVSLSDMVRDYPEVYKNMLVKRNNNWLPAIEKMLLDKDIELILVGALHLVGKDGLLQKLRDKGYVVEHFD